MTYRTNPLLENGPGTSAKLRILGCKHIFGSLCDGLGAKESLCTRGVGVCDGQFGVLSLYYMG